MNFSEVHLKLHIDELKQRSVPWKDNSWVVFPEEILNPELCNFTGALVYLPAHYDEAVKDYYKLFDTHVSEDLDKLYLS